MALPEARIVATDLNPAMLDVAALRGSAPNLSFEPADAQSLPFPAQAFDLVLAQFGAMFFPDKPGAWYPATLLTDVRPGQPAHDEEIFGPVAAIIEAHDEASADRATRFDPRGGGFGIANNERGVVTACVL